MPRQTIASLQDHVKQLLIEKAEAERALEAETARRVSAERSLAIELSISNARAKERDARLVVEDVHDLVIGALGLDSVDIDAVEMRNNIRKATNYRELSLVLSVINTIRNARDRAREAAREAEREKVEATLDALVTNIVKDAAEVVREKGETKAPTSAPVPDTSIRPDPRRYRVVITKAERNAQFVQLVKTLRVVSGQSTPGIDGRSYFNLGLAEAKAMADRAVEGEKSVVVTDLSHKDAFEAIRLLAQIPGCYVHMEAIS